ncbi:MAG: ABC transporter permease [Chloroflexota bacterium]|nr:ABC transporter permease [Chloroflexota bacterium]MDE3192333.1 ABC transporter permease [Chloroflexota bacterium]
MRRFVIRRLLYTIPTLIGVSLITFLISHLAPGDPVRLYTFGDPNARPEDIEAVRHALGLDLPLPLQYVDWASQAVRGDFGQSILYHQSATMLILARVPNSLQLAIAALVLQLLIGVPLGVVAALRRGSVVDQAIRVFSTVFHAVPSFWFGLILIVVFAVQLRWLPSQGMLTIGKDDWDILDRLRHLVMPAFVLSLAGIASYARIMRTETLEVINQDYIRTARAKGLLEPTVIAVHAVRNALIPMVTALGGILAFLISGALVIEQVFTWPGIGQLTYQSVVGKDYPVVMAGVMISSLLLVISYLLRDVVYVLVDPRVKTG